MGASTLQKMLHSRALHQFRLFLQTLEKDLRLRTVLYKNKAFPKTWEEDSSKHGTPHTCYGPQGSKAWKILFRVSSCNINLWFVFNLKQRDCNYKGLSNRLPQECRAMANFSKGHGWNLETKLVPAFQGQ
jgi:hypothetical protein